MNSRILRNRRAMNGGLLAAILMTMLAAMVIMISGCTAIHGVPSTQPSDLADYRDDASDAVTLGLLVSNDKPATIKRVYAAAVKIRDVASKSTDFSGLRQVAVAALLQGVNQDDRIVAQSVINLIFRRLKRNLNIDLDAQILPPEQFAAARALIIALCDGAIEVSRPGV